MQVMNVTYDIADTSIFDIKEVNSSFASGSLKVMYTGKNRNGSSISKDAVLRALPTLKNVPIVCHWDPLEREIGGHDMELVRDDDGLMRLRNLTEPCGVVPDHASFRFETVADNEGNEHEYLIIDGVLLWKRQDVFNYISKDLGGKVKHSMEISVFDCEQDSSGILEINQFEFTALCLLGNCEPCFQGSELEVFSSNNFKKQMAQMMSDLKEEFSMVVPPVGDNDIHPQNHPMEGGEKVLNEKLALVAEYGLEVENLGFSIEDLTLEELREKFEAMKNTVDPVSAKPAEKIEGFSLAGQMLEEVRKALSVETIECSWGEMPRYQYVDHDQDSMMVYCYDAEDWNLYGFPYSMNGDNVVIDFACKKRKKFEIVDFDDGEQVSPFAEIFAEMANQYNTNDAKWSEKYTEASNTIASMENELVTLRQFKSDADEAALTVARDEIFAQFEDLTGIEEFDALREHCSEYELDVLEEKCFAIRGRKGTLAKFTYEPKSHKLKIDKTSHEEEPYGGLFERFLPSR